MALSLTGGGLPVGFSTVYMVPGGDAAAGPAQASATPKRTRLPTALQILCKVPVIRMASPPDSTTLEAVFLTHVIS